MRLSMMGFAGTLMSCMLMSGTVFAAASHEFASATSDRVLLSANTLIDGRTDNLASNLVPDFRETNAVSQTDRIHLAFAAPPLSPTLVASRGDSSNATFSLGAPEQPPSLWLMGAVALFLIAYQLRRKHRLLRPHRFHEL
jgi:hypothetical protein